ncbi:hypothetical protein CGC64_04735 [Bacteroides caccae]|nr:hypothetical protein CGC64_04735 [Bacteroides caccae]PQL35945.1 hypothetical protein C5Z00_15540 [Bacteroides caccae]
MQVTITHNVRTIRNSLIFANNGLVVFIFIATVFYVFLQYSDLALKMLLSLVFIKIWIKKNADRRMLLLHRRFLVVRCEVGL